MQSHSAKTVHFGLFLPTGSALRRPHHRKPQARCRQAGELHHKSHDTPTTRRQSAPNTAKPPHHPRRWARQRPTARLRYHMPVTTVAMADVPVTDATWRDRRKEQRPLTTLADGNHDQRQRRRSTPSTRASHQTPDTNPTPGAKHRPRTPNRLTVHAAACRLTGQYADTRRPITPDFPASVRPH